MLMYCLHRDHEFALEVKFSFGIKHCILMRQNSYSAVYCNSNDYCDNGDL